MSIVTKRIYALPSEADGYRVLVDRLWPRGLSKAVASIDLWLRDIAPSTELRQWYGHEVARWPEFVERYRRELEGRRPLLERLAELEAEHGTVTLLFAARDETHNEAEVIADVLRRPLGAQDAAGMEVLS
jgi:uncharacterized protein YeaO (DUF488 family)